MIAGQTLNVSSAIGLIALFGICVQNDVILVAKINDYRKQGLSLHKAAVEGALTKFRPTVVPVMYEFLGNLENKRQGKTI